MESSEENIHVNISAYRVINILERDVKNCRRILSCLSKVLICGSHFGNKFLVSMDIKGPFTETFSNKKVVECQEKKHQNIEVQHKKVMFCSS